MLTNRAQPDQVGDGGVVFIEVSSYTVRYAQIRADGDDRYGVRGACDRAYLGVTPHFPAVGLA